MPRTRRRLSKKLGKLGIRSFSFWGSSMENLTKRPFEEKRTASVCMKNILRGMIENEAIHRDRARIQ